MAVKLQEISFNKKNWYVDNRLKEIRDTENPHDRISFGEIERLYDEVC